MTAKLVAKLGGLAVLVGLLNITGCAATRSPSETASSPTASLEDSAAMVSQSLRSESEIWSLLQQEGAVVLLRHALAPGTGDPANFQLDDCSTQRNLSEAGRAQAVRIGEAFRSRQIPVAQVLSSQWCRCLETAELMDVGTVEPLPALNSVFRDRAAEPERTAQIRQLIVNHRNTDGTVVLVTHAANISAISGISVRSGAMVVLQANKGEQIDIIGQIGAIR
ncbi:MAG: histidine phosphatase family protein [Cyanophyceae cyanobacterium]